MRKVNYIIPVTDHCKSWLLDNMPSGLFKVTVARGTGLPFSEEHVSKVVDSMLQAGLEPDSDFMVAREI